MLSRVEQFENTPFFVLVWMENFSYLELFLIHLHHFVMWFNFSSLSWSLIQHGRQHDVFCVVDNNFFFNRLFRVKYCFSSHEYCTPENQEWLKTITGVKGYKESNTTFSTLQADTSGLKLAEQVHGGTTL